MAKECSYCGQPIPFARRLTGKDLHTECEQKQQELLFSYEQALRKAGRSRELTQETEDNVAQIAAAGSFKDAQLKETNTRIYTTLKDAILEDGDFTRGERDFLRHLQRFLCLSDEEADSEQLDYVRELASIAEGNLPEIVASVNLRKGEVPHYEGLATWKHVKTRRKRVAGSRGQSVRIAKGFSLRVGATPGRTEEWEELQTVDEGKIIVTSQRLLFVGTKKNLNVTHQKILDMELFADAVKIHRGTTNPTYLFMEDPLAFYAVLSTALEAGKE